MKPLISVIMPAYNREKIIGATLDSVIAQDYENLEIIVVDDGSCDGTADMARGMLENSSKRWRVLSHEHNKGESAARNTGLDAASGEYVQFMDSDDLVEESFISTLYRLASEKDCDIVFCGYRTRDETGAEKEISPAPPSLSLNPGRIYPGEELALGMMVSLRIALWTMLFRRDFLLSKCLRFNEEHSFGLDREFSIKALTMSEKVAFSSRYMYIYVQHDDMTMRTSLATKEKRLAHYADAASAHLNATNYMAEHVRSPKILKAVRHLLLPEYHLKMFKLYAWLGDYETFRKELGSPGMRRMLWSSWKVFFKEPQIFLKAFFLLAFPKLTFEVRRRTSRFK